MATATPASDALCRFSGRNSDTMADLLDRYLASEEIVGDETAPEPTGEAFTALLRARVAFGRLPRVQQLAFMRRLAQEYAYGLMLHEHTPAQTLATTPPA